jgi:quercetin dioxygenase-like cupin family protein
MDNKEVVRQRMLQEGFSLINEYDDPPNEVFPDHDHPGDQLLVVLKGSITITMQGKTSVLKPGDEMFFPAKVMHSAQVGSEGCLYIDGERSGEVSKS